MEIVGAFSSTLASMLAAEHRIVGDEEAAAPVVEEPLRLASGLERAEREAVGLEVVLLRIVHRDEEVLGGRRRRRPGDEQRGAHEATGHGRPATAGGRPAPAAPS